MSVRALRPHELEEAYLLAVLKGIVKTPHVFLEGKTVLQTTV